MEKEFVPYELAVKLEALGFDGKSIATIDQTNYVHIKGTKWPIRGAMWYDNIDCPTFSQAFRWFKEKYKLFSAILPFQDIEDNVKLCYYYCVIDLDECQDEDILCNESSLGTSAINFSSHEEAELACLERLIEIVESKSK